MSNGSHNWQSIPGFRVYFSSSFFHYFSTSCLLVYPKKKKSQTKINAFLIWILKFIATYSEDFQKIKSNAYAIAIRTIFITDLTLWITSNWSSIFYALNIYRYMVCFQKQFAFWIDAFVLQNTSQYSWWPQTYVPSGHTYYWIPNFNNWSSGLSFIAKLNNHRRMWMQRRCANF